MAEKYENVKLLETLGNKGKKGGAVNQALEKIRLGRAPDAVLLMDADTRIHHKAVEEGWKTLESNQNLASVCSKAGVLAFEGGNFYNRILYQLQRLEYATFDSQRVETLDIIKVVHGMAAIHRWSAIMAVGGFDEDNLVEDYDLTIKYKEAAYDVTVNLNMEAWTEVPVSLKDWWRQRLRWNRGGLETLKNHGWNKVTRVYILQHYWVNFLLIFQWIFTVAFLMMVINNKLAMHGFVAIVIFLSLFSSIYRLKYLGKVTLRDWLYRVSVFPESTYGVLKTLNLYCSYFMFFTKQQQSW